MKIKNIIAVSLIATTIIILIAMVCWSEEIKINRADVEMQVKDYVQQIQEEQILLNQLTNAVEERKGNIQRLLGGIIALKELLQKEVTIEKLKEPTETQKETKTE